VLKVAAMMMAACEKFLHAATNATSGRPTNDIQPWIDDCIAQATYALARSRP